MDSEDESQLVIVEQEDSDEPEVVAEDLLSKVARMEVDVFLRMLWYLNCQSITSLEQTCHTLRNFISHSDIWKRKFRLKKAALERVEREQRINLKLDSEIFHKPALNRLEQMERNLTEKKYRREKTSFYEVVGFNGCESLVSALGCDFLLVNEDNHGYVDGVVNAYSVHDLHKGEKIPMQVDFSGEDFLHADIVDDSLAVLRYIQNDIDDEADDQEDGGGRLEYYNLGVFKISAQHCKRVQRRGLISSRRHGTCSQVKLVNSCNSLLLLGILDRRVMITTYEKSEDTSILYETSRRQLQQTDVRLSRPVFRLEEQYLASLVSSQHCQVWDHRSGDSIWSRTILSSRITRFPPASLTSLAFSHPHIIVGSSEGKAEIWNVMTDSLIRTIHHEKDSGLNVGFRQLEVREGLLLSLAECGWLTAWDWRACLSPDTPPTARLAQWRTNTKHETPISRFVVNSSRIVTVEKHKMSCEWDERKFVVIRDFWQFREKEKRKAVSCEGRDGGESKRRKNSKAKKEKEKLKNPKL